MHTTLIEIDRQSIIVKLTAFRCKFHRNKGTPFTHSLNSFLDRSRDDTNLDCPPRWRKRLQRACGRSLSGDENEDAWFYFEMNFFHGIEMLIKCKLKSVDVYKMQNNKLLAR